MIDLRVLDFLNAPFGVVGAGGEVLLPYSTLSWRAVTARISFVAFASIIPPPSSTTGIVKS